jgi:hypothetical protein
MYLHKSKVKVGKLPKRIAHDEDANVLGAGGLDEQRLGLGFDHLAIGEDDLTLIEGFLRN